MKINRSVNGVTPFTAANAATEANRTLNLEKTLIVASTSTRKRRPVALINSLESLLFPGYLTSV